MLQYTQEALLSLTQVKTMKIEDLFKNLLEGKHIAEQNLNEVYKIENNCIIEINTGKIMLNADLLEPVSDKVTLTVSFPRPLDTALPDETTYYWVNLTLGIVELDVWRNAKVDFDRLHRKRCHLTKQDAEEHLKAFTDY